MRLKRALQLGFALGLAAVAGVASVRLDWWDARPVRDERPFTFSEDFENASDFADLFPRDMSRWHGRQLLPAQNVVTLTSEFAHSGRQALKCQAFPSAEATSKADLERGGLRFMKGDDIWSQCWFLLKGGAGAENVFLWDLEASTKYQSPGRRLYLQSGDVLASDLGKWFFAPKFAQPWNRRVPLPKDRWVRLRVHLFLSDRPDGVIEVWQDDVKVLDGHGQTLPTAKAIYDRLQVGLTANGSGREQTLYVDDVVISNRPLP